MQESIQDTKKTPEITFEDLCSNWDGIVKKEGGYSQVNVDKQYGENSIKDYGCCIVGEAFKL